MSSSRESTPTITKLSGSGTPTPLLQTVMSKSSENLGDVEEESNISKLQKNYENLQKTNEQSLNGSLSKQKPKKESIKENLSNKVNIHLQFEKKICIQI